MTIISQSTMIRASQLDRQSNSGAPRRNRSNVTSLYKSVTFARCYFIVAGILLFGIHLFLFFMVEHRITVTQQQQQLGRTHESMQRSKDDPMRGTPNPKANAQFFFNNLPVKQMNDGITPKVTKFDCVSPFISHGNGLMNRTHDWMVRTCEYTNLCWNMSSRQYVAITDGDSSHQQSIPDVSIGGINPRWKSIPNIADPEWGEVVKMRWKPEEIPRSSIDLRITDFYELDQDTILLPFHSMAGHNVGHLLWDDFYPIYSALRMRGLISASSNVGPNKTLLLIRHVLENTTLYANCDIRRNKRMQCKTNFERFLPLLGVDPNTFFTTKTTQLKMSKGRTESKPVPVGPRISMVCAKTTVAGIGLLTDHGWHDHGWESKSSPPHNAGRGRLFYDFAQFLMQHTTPKTKDRSEVLPVPQITFSLESSRDWVRRLNFTHQMEALMHESKNSATREYTVQSYHMSELSLQEQMAVAVETNIFVTACGGGSMTATFLPRNAVVIVYYDTEGGMDFDNNHLQANHQPARLDWDLLNNAAHLRVHWLPIRGMDSPEHKKVFSALIRHEIATIQRARAMS